MKYQISYTVDLLFSWEKRTATIEVDLSDEEVEQIRSVIEIGETHKTYLAVKKSYPNLYSKLFDAGLEFMWYTTYLDIRISGEWKEIAERTINEKSLMKEDIDSNGFDPHTKEGKLLRGENRYNAWVQWEEEHLSDLTFQERSYYYQDRYDIHDVNNENVNCSIKFPQSIIEPEINRLKELREDTKDYPITFVLDYDELKEHPEIAIILVPLTLEETNHIKEIVPEGKENEAYELIKADDYRLHHKIVNYAEDFERYVEIIWKRRYLRYYEELDFIKEEDHNLMQDDIKNRNYDPHDENGKLLEGEELLQHWMNWEEHQLDDLSYSDRQDFYFDRYGLENDYFNSSSDKIPFYFHKDFFRKDK